MIPSDDEVLHGSANYLGRNGHIQGQMSAPGSDAEEPPACALGAMKRVSLELADDATTGWDVYIRAADRLGRHLRKTGEVGDYGNELPPHLQVPEWNDRPGRTAEDVILAMKRAADE